MVYRILEYISVFLALIIVLPLHEYAHGYVAYKCGDPTAKFSGRLTLNPLSHFDKIGLICFVFAGFGWAKPVPVNPNNFRNYRRGCFYVSIAGVTANYLLAFIAAPLFYLSLKIPQFGYFTYVLSNSLFYVYHLSIVFFIFNLLPIYPLDGFRAIDSFTKKRNKIYYFLRDKGIFILYGLFFLSIISDALNVPQIDILGRLISFLSYYVSYPINLFWGLIF